MAADRFIIVYLKYIFASNDVNFKLNAFKSGTRKVIVSGKRGLGKETAVVLVGQVM